ncbi:hypothetical protein D9M71_829220 [compost metagenome]
MVVAVFALPVDHGPIAQGNDIDRPADVILRAIRHDPDAQRLATSELRECREHAEFGFAPVNILVAVDEIEQLGR